MKNVAALLSLVLLVACSSTPRAPRNPSSEPYKSSFVHDFENVDARSFSAYVGKSSYKPFLGFRIDGRMNGDLICDDNRFRGRVAGIEWIEDVSEQVRFLTEVVEIAGNLGSPLKIRVLSCLAIDVEPTDALAQTRVRSLRDTFALKWPRK